MAFSVWDADPGILATAFLKFCYRVVGGVGFGLAGRSPAFGIVAPDALGVLAKAFTGKGFLVIPQTPGATERSHPRGYRDTGTGENDCFLVVGEFNGLHEDSFEAISSILALAGKIWLPRKQGRGIPSQTE